ncbi:TPA: hypothetical protein ACH3X3_011230 [Trebouxia sp. C0006]
MRKGDTFDIGILARSLLVLDADNREMMEFLEATFPVLRTVPMETTAKGAHHFMLRSLLCDQLGLYDKANCFLSVNCEDPTKSLQVDLKTVSRREPYRDRCKTPGLITVSPSVGKEWIRPLWETPLTEVSDEMAEQLAVMYQARSSAVSSGCSQNDVKRKRGRPSTSLILHEATETEQMMSTVQTMPKQIVQEVLPTILDKGFYNIDVKSYSEQGFSFVANTDDSGDHTECPLCSCTHTSQLWFCIVCESVERLSNTDREELLITVHPDKAVAQKGLL